MFNRILTLELGNDKGLHSLRNLRILLLTYIFPNISAFLMAIIIGVQRFYEPMTMILLVLIFNVYITIAVQYLAQRNIFSKLEKEALLKFLPTKISQFIKIRLLLFVMKLYFPVLLFSTVFLSFFMEENVFAFIILIFSNVFIIYFQICVAIIIRYCVNVWKRLPLQILQVSLFLAFIISISLYTFIGTIRLLEMLELFLDNMESASFASFKIDSLHIFSVVFIIAVISIILGLIVNQLNLNVLFHNRNLSFDLKTAMIERLHLKVYGLWLSRIQKNILEKDIKSILRDSKVMLFVLGFQHLVIFGMMAFFFIMIFDKSDNNLFMPKFHFIFLIGQMIFMGLISIGNKEFTSAERDFKVLKGYHISLPKNHIIHVKVKLLQAFVLPKITVIYLTFIIAVLMMNEYTLALIYIFNYMQCYLFAKTWSLWSVKQSNQMNSKNEILYYVNVGLIILFLIILLQTLRSTMGQLFLWQILLLGILTLLYCFHLFVFKDVKKFKTD